MDTDVEIRILINDRVCCKQVFIIQNFSISVYDNVRFSLPSFRITSIVDTFGSQANQVTMIIRQSFFI